MSYVFVLDGEKRPLAPIHPGYARWLLSHQRAAVFRRYPFTILLKRSAPGGQPTPLRLKLDPGSQTTGLALVNDQSGQVVWAAELTHRGKDIKRRLANRHIIRRTRRARKTRYRERRFANRRRKPGSLPPSLASRKSNVATWEARLRRLCPIGAFSLELAKFDTHLMQNPDISGIEYQQGTPEGYELREYLLEKWGRRCAYCGKTGVPLELEHIVPKSRGGSNRQSNLTLACVPCNQAKGTLTAAEFGHPEIQAQARQPLKDAAAMNTIRWALYEMLKATGLPVEVGTGGGTKYNRCTRGLPKTHWVDAACVGSSTPEFLHIESIVPLLITATGRQNRQMCLMDECGFPRSRAKGPRMVCGFQTGDIVRAVVTKGKRSGTHQGKVAIKANRYFAVTTPTGTIRDIAYRFCRLLQRADGYAYRKGGKAALPLPLLGGVAPRPQ